MWESWETTLPGLTCTVCLSRLSLFHMYDVYIYTYMLYKYTYILIYTYSDSVLDSTVSRRV